MVLSYNQRGLNVYIFVMHISHIKNLHNWFILLYGEITTAQYYKSYEQNKYHLFFDSL